MVGRTLGHYEIIELLGAGAMGEVYLGEDTRLGRKVAIKVLPEAYASDPERLARFEQEARAAAALNHPNIEVIHGTEESDGAVEAPVPSEADGLAQPMDENGGGLR
jgi:serine/threonine protein kinase